MKDIERKQIFRKLRPLIFSNNFMKRINKAYKYFKRSDIENMRKQLDKIKSIKKEVTPFIYNIDTKDEGSFGMELDYIEKLIRMLKFNYENDGKTYLIDNVYDEMLNIFKIYRLEPIESELVMKRAEAVTEHRFPLLKGTLDKCKNVLSEKGKKSIEKFMISVLTAYRELELDEPLEISISYKYDGTSVVFDVDEYGYIISAITRGKNGKGVNIKKLFKNCYFPAIKNGLKANGIQCELMMSNKDIKAYSTEKMLNKEVDEPYKNSRGSVTSVLTGLTGQKYSKYLDPVPLRVVYQDDGESIDYGPEIIAECKLFNKNRAGESIPYNYKNLVFSQDLLNSKEVDDYDILLKILTAIGVEIDSVSKIRKDLPYAIDGIVISVLNKKLKKKLGRKGEINQWQIAYKFESEEQVTELTGITYSVNRTGLVVPKAHYKPIYFNGTRQTKATLSSRDNMESYNLRLGSKIIIAYSNDVIPYFSGVDTYSDNPIIEFPKVCPICGHKLFIKDKHSFCRNMNCPSRKPLQFENFIKVLGFRDFSIEFINALIEENLISSFEDILHLDEKKEQMLSIEGIGEKKVKGIEKKLKELKSNPITEDVLMNALGIAGPKISKNIVSEISLKELITNPNKIYDVSIEGVEDSKKDYLFKIKQLNENGEINRIIDILKPIRFVKKDFRDKVRFTGFRDKELEKQLNAKGIEVVNSYKGISYLVVPNITYTSSKTDEADRRGIEIIDIDDLKDIYKL